MKKTYYTGLFAFICILLCTLPSFAQKFDPNHVYKIVNVKHGLVLSEPFDDKFLPHGEVYSGLARQEWYIREIGTNSNHYVITNRRSQKTLTQQSFEYDPRRSIWNIVKVNCDLHYAIVDHHKRRAIAMGTDVTVKATRSSSYITGDDDEQWDIIDVSTNPEVYTIVNMLSSRRLQVENSSEDQGSEIVQGNFDDNKFVYHANEQWILTDLSNGYYAIINRNTGQALEIGGGQPQNQNAGSKANQWPYYGGDAQQWAINFSTGTITNKLSGYVLEIGASSQDYSAPANQWYNFNNLNQRWIITKISQN